MSNAISTIPNYCSYEAFKTGFSEGIGVYSEHKPTCEQAKLPNRIRIRYWGNEHCVDATYLIDVTNNSKYMTRNLKFTNSCDWFDAYSVKYAEKLKSKSRAGSDDYRNDDHNQDIEDVLNNRIKPVASCSDSRLSSSRNSTAKSWRLHIECETESFRYSTEKGCIDWLEMCDDGLRKTNSDRDLIRSFDDQFQAKKFEVRQKFHNSYSDRCTIFERGMFPVCQNHLHRKFGTDTTWSSSEDVDVRTVNTTEETTLEEEVFEEDLYYLGPPKVCSFLHFTDNNQQSIVSTPCHEC